ncbi:MAG TPA: two-component regulator propeller domain-containing protein [Acidisarcina sp.]
MRRRIPFAERAPARLIVFWPRVTTYFLLLALSLSTKSRALDPHLALTQYGRQSWQTDNGLPQNTVRSVLQTRDGYLWLATDSGLVRFDGVRFVVFDKQSPSKLRSNSINSLFEDRDGSLWISTADGLTRRRGTEFKTFTTAEGLPDNTVWSVYQDRAASLWALTSGGLASFDNVRGKFVAVEGGPRGLTSNSSVVEAADGSLWVGANDGVIHLRNGSPVASPSGLAPLETEALAATADGRIWVGTRSGLEIIDGTRVTVLTRAQGLPADEVTSLFSDRAGRVWVGTAGGLGLIGPGSGEAGQSPANTSPAEVGQTAAGQTRASSAYPAGLVSQIKSLGVSDGLPGERIQTIYQDRAGAIWVGTNRGVARLQSGAMAPHFESLGASDPLSGESVLTMFEDREGSLWLGTESGGLAVLHDQKFTTYTAANGLSEDLVRSVYQDRKGLLWIGTNGGGLDRLDRASTDTAPSLAHDPKFTNISTAAGLASNIVLALADDDAGDLWVGTPDGLNRLHDGKVTVYTSADGLADDFVRSLYTAPDGTLWIGTRRGLSHLVNGVFTSFTTLDGLGSNLVGAILQTRYSAANTIPPPAATPAILPPPTLWIGTLGGLSRFQDGKFATLTTADGLSSNIVTALHETADDALWIGTSGGGLNRLFRGTVTRFPAASLPENVYSILEDGRQNLWLSSDKGVFRVSLADLNGFAAGTVHQLMPAAYGRADGMMISEASSGGHPSAWRLTDGTLAFATLKGVAMIDPEHAPTNSEPPPVAIEQVTFDDRPVEDLAQQSGPIVLPPGQGRLVFDYTAMSFIAPQKVRFRYKLEGFDRDWIDAGARRTAFYTNLPARSYTFRVQACNNDGVWNDAGAALDLRLRPHLYQTWIFYALLVVLAAMLGTLVYRRRVRRVESQFSAVLAERGRIAREIHDTLAQSLVAISMQLEVVARLLPSSGATTADGETSVSEAAREHLDQARILTRNSLTEARSSIWDLRSPDPATSSSTQGATDLATRMSTMAAQVTASTGIKIQSKVGGAYHPLPAKLESELLRIAQEAATNAVRHANPQHILIDLVYERHQLRMTIEDDGCGFSGLPHPQSTGPQGHFGLTGMNERAQQIGGTMTIESTPGDGTRIQVEVPIK